MIKLSKTIYDNFVADDDKDYVSFCLDKYAENTKNRDLLCVNEKLFRKKVSRKDLFYTDNEFDPRKFKEIILFDFEDLSKNTEVLNNYFKTGLLLNELDLLEDVNDCEIEKKRKEIVYIYKNDWINGLFTDEIFCDEDEFKKIKKKIKQDYNALTLIKPESKKHIMDYNLISSIRDKLLASMEISVCPYCNRQFISSFKVKYKKSKYKIRSMATLDHFYPKSAFPLFALSLYNFIPACYSCNSILKKTSTKGIMYPFSKGYEDYAHFKMKNFKDLDALLGNNDNLEIYVDYEKENNEDITNSLELFKTEEIYQHHSNHVQSILLKSTIYSDKYKEMLKNDLRSKGLDYSIEGLNAFIYNLDLHDTEQKNVILGRLTKDILKQIDEWKNKP